MKERKTVVGKLLQKIGKSVPSILELGADLTGIDALDKAAELISGDKKLSETDKEIMLMQLANAKDLEVARLADIDSARDMQKAALAQSDLFSKRFIYYLASFWSIIAAVFIFVATLADIPSENIRFVDTLIGFIIGTIISTIIGFFYGSSSSSDKKTDLLESIKGKF